MYLIMLKHYTSAFERLTGDGADGGLNLIDEWSKVRAPEAYSLEFQFLANQERDVVQFLLHFSDGIGKPPPTSKQRMPCF